MPIDGILLNRIVKNIQNEGPLKINRITQPSQTDFVFNTFGQKRQRLLISTHALYSRIQFTSTKNQPSIELTHFLSVLRKYLEGSIMQDIVQRNNDRIVTLIFSYRDEMGVIQEIHLVIELMGRNANLILMHESGKIIDALRRTGNFMNTARAVVPGAIYEYPDALDKISIEYLSVDDKNISIRQKYEGISPILEKEITFRLDHQEPQAIIDELLTSDTLYIYNNDYHILPLTHLNKEATIHPLMDGMDLFFHDIETEERLNFYTKDAMKVVKRELKRANSKLPKLFDDLDRALNADYLREHGELLLSFHTQAPSGLKEITLKDFEGNVVTIPLEEKLNGIANANDYFKRYKKAKTSLRYLEKQIEITQDRVDYFTSLKNHLEMADIEDALEIKEELVEAKLLKTKAKPSKKTKKPNYMIIEVDKDNTIFIGKNNLQNDTVTFKLAKKEDLWFHAAKTFGAHVVLKSNHEPKKELLELCAMFAAYFSNHRSDVNVEVYYTKIKNIKKIPGKQPGMVRMSTQESIYITPDLSLIKTYLPQ